MVDRRLLLGGGLVASTVLCAALGITDPSNAANYPTRFLLWNLFLAWLPLVFAVIAGAARRTSVAVVSGVLWLAFLPNAPYLVTDLMHLRGPSGEMWRHILQFGVAAWTGVLLGVVSLRIVHLRVAGRFGDRVGWFFAAAATAACAVGVALGRFMRWNSWDVVSTPRRIVDDSVRWLADPLADVRSTGVALAVAAFFGLAYLTIVGLEGARLARPADHLRR
jgi:uncharacterized membrane protein